MSAHFIIAGGGIGGLAAALAVAQTGATVTVFEQASEFRETGAGVQIGPNAAHALGALGLGEELEEQADRPTALMVRDGRSAKTLVQKDFTESFVRDYGLPYRVMHRGDLLKILLQACQQNTQITLYSSDAVEDIHVEAERVEVQTISGTHEADAFIGADGLYSMSRARFLQDQGPRASGHIIARALIDVENIPRDSLPDLLTQNQVSLWLCDHGHVVHYPLRGGKFINLVAVFKGEVERAGWHVTAKPGEVSAAFTNIDQYLRTMLELPDHTDGAHASAWFKWRAVDREPAPKWGHDAFTLLGDAAHPALPYLAQGAAMALEDACVLKQQLIKHEAVADAFRAYETIRQPRTARLQQQSRSTGDIYHMTGVKRFARNSAMKLFGNRLVQDKSDWIYRWKL